MYTTCCLMVIHVHPCAKFGMPVSKSKDEHAHTQIHGESIILLLRPKVKVIQRICIFVTHRHNVIYSCVKYDKTTSLDQKSCGPNTKPCQKTHTSHLKVKCQHRIEINADNGDRPVCQIWYANVKAVTFTVKMLDYGISTSCCRTRRLHGAVLCMRPQKPRPRVTW